jgi:hypothetical protein
MERNEQAVWGNSWLQTRHQAHFGYSAIQAVIARTARGDRVDWAGVAVDGGYCDQSHLNREFRVFSGVTPAEYQPVCEQRPSHVPV